MLSSCYAEAHGPFLGDQGLHLQPRGYLRRPTGGQIPTAEIAEVKERRADEVRFMRGRLADGTLASVSILSEGSPAANPAFDVTPARLVTGIITERGVSPATAAGLRRLYPEVGG